MKAIIRCLGFLLGIGVLTSSPVLCQGPSFSLGTDSSLNHAGRLTVTIPLRNGGATAATNIVVTAAALGAEGSTVSLLPLKLKPLSRNQEITLTLEFASSSALIGSKQLLTVRGTYMVDGTSEGFASNRFIKIPEILPKQDTFAIYGNKTDPGIFHAELAEGEIADFYGTKDALGHASIIQSARVFGRSGVTQYSFDDGSHPSHIKFPSGMTWKLTWSSNTTVSVTAMSSDGTSEISTVVDFVTGKSKPNSFVSPGVTASPEVAGADRSPSSSMTVSNMSPASGVGNAFLNVVTCGKPEANAGVTFDVGWLLSGRSGLTATEIGPGLYSAMIPTPDQTAQDDSAGKAAAAARALEQICTVLDDVKNVLPPGITAGDVICTSLTALLAGGGAGPLALEVGAACEVVFKGLEVVCTAQQILAKVNVAIDSVNLRGPVTLHPVAVLDGHYLTPIGAYFEFKSLSGPFTFPAIDFGCPSLDIGIQPQKVMLNVGDQFPAKSSVTWDGNNYTSSTLNLHWSSGDESIASVSQSGTVMGLKEGTTSVFVRDLTTGSSSNPIPVTVSFVTPIVGNWAGSGTATSRDGNVHALSVSASVTRNGPSLSATIAITDVAGTEIETDTGDLNGFSFAISVASTSNGETVNVSGSFSPNGRIMSGTGTDFTDQVTGNGSLTVSADGFTINGSATTTNGDTIVWVLGKQP